MVGGRFMNKHILYTNYFKRFLDFSLSLIAVLLFWWLFLIIAIFVKIFLGGPVIFSQMRPGKDEKIFKLYKFRTMTNQKDENGNLLPDEIRLTKFGKILRKTSMDELPEIFNILMGDMSIVGPRPLLVEYLPMYNKQEKHRHDVRPGLTGLAQVMGRNSISWEEKFAFDLQYIEEMSFFLDVKILFLTVWKSFVKSEGISAEGSATMPPFYREKISE